jgi:hypothetical protein
MRLPNLEQGTQLVDRLTDHALRAASLARAAAAAVSSAQSAGRDLDPGELQRFHQYRLQLAADLRGLSVAAGLPAEDLGTVIDWGQSRAGGESLAQ